MSFFRGNWTYSSFADSLYPGLRLMRTSPTTSVPNFEGVSFPRNTVTSSRRVGIYTYEIPNDEVPNLRLECDYGEPWFDRFQRCELVGNVEGIGRVSVPLSTMAYQHCWEWLGLTDKPAFSSPAIMFKAYFSVLHLREEFARLEPLKLAPKGCASPPLSPQVSYYAVHYPQGANSNDQYIPRLKYDPGTNEWGAYIIPYAPPEWTARWDDLDSIARLAEIVAEPDLAMAFHELGLRAIDDI